MDKKWDSFFLNKNKDKPPRKDNKMTLKKENTDCNRAKPEFRKTDEKFQGKSQQKFDENRPGLKNEEDLTSKKPFDKKTYRLKKYSKKYKLEQWEEQRKKRLLKDYYKEVQNESVAMGSYKPVSFDEDVTDGNQEVGRFVKHPDLIEKELPNNNPKKDPFTKAKERFNKIKQDKLLKRQELEKIKEEKQQKLQEYKKKKQERFKKLSKKTKHGQPVMTGRLELLLEKLQNG